VATQRLRDIQLFHGAIVPLSLYFLTLAVSGERKTTVDNLALQPIVTHEKELAQYYGAIMACIKSHNKKSPDPPPDAPPSPVIICPKPTMQGIVHLFSNGSMGLALCTNDGLSFLGGYAMGKDNKLATIADLSELWDGKPHKIIQASKPIEVLQGRRLALHLMVQPDYGVAFINGKDTQHQGLAGRILVSYPKSTIGLRLHKEVGPQAYIDLAEYHNCLTAIMKMQSNTDDLPYLTLSPEAKQSAIAFSDDCEQQASGKLESIQSFALKATEQASRIAGVLQLVDNPQASVVTGDMMKSAIEITQYYLREALRIGAMAGHDETETLANTLLTKLKAKGKRYIYPVWIHQNIRLTGCKGKDSFTPIIRILEDMGQLVPCEAGFKVDGKPRKEAWEVVACR
jgi:hypothetical protein